LLLVCTVLAGINQHKDEKDSSNFVSDVAADVLIVLLLCHILPFFWQSYATNCTTENAFKIMQHFGIQQIKPDMDFGMTSCTPLYDPFSAGSLYRPNKN
jgi:hypothetical protein